MTNPERDRTLDELAVGRMIAGLPPAPRGWVEAAYEIPTTQAELESIIDRIERDEKFRAAIQADIAEALAEAGFTADDALVDRLRRQLSAG